jgi:hypothetical protein
MAGPWIFFGMVAFGASVFSWLGWTMFRGVRVRAEQWLKVEGEVTGFEERRGNKGGTLYAPVYRYVIGGAELTGTSSVARRPAGYYVGDPIPLVVNPANNAESDVLDKMAKGLAYGVLGAGIFLVGGAVGILILILTGRMA